MILLRFSRDRAGRLLLVSGVPRLCEEHAREHADSGIDAGGDLDSGTEAQRTKRRCPVPRSSS